MNDKRIGLQIKKARLESQMTQADIAKKIGVTWEMISRYENGKSSPRKNLEKIAEVLKKPIQYFFGVEEAPISDEIKRLTDLLIKKGSNLQQSVEVPLVETLEGFDINKAIKLTKQIYSCPTWIINNFKNIFAYKINEVISDVVSIGKGDIGFFSKNLKPKVGNFVLMKRKRRLYIDRYSKSLSNKVYAVLLAIEKRYYRI